MWFGVEKEDSDSVQAIREGVKDFAGKYTFVWLDYKELGSFLKTNFGCEAAKCATLVKGRNK